LLCGFIGIFSKNLSDRKGETKMKGSTHIPVKLGFVFMLFGLLMWVGCSTNSAKKPDMASESAQTPPAGKEKRVQTARVSPPSSSLEAMREGKAPAAGPLKDVYFDYDKYDLRSDARETLKANADYLKANPSARAEIEGHCDERGTTEYNLALGSKRAQAAKDYLVTVGIAAGRLSTRSYGKEAPVCTEHNEDCWQKNRHDRFVVTSTPTS
jgi:peptidoglycan-associated lipoprotein